MAESTQVRLFLRRYEEAPNLEIRGTDDSHIVFADVLDSGDARGLSIGLNTEKHREDPSLERFKILVPWHDVISIVVARQFSSAIQDESRRVGFNPDSPKSVE
jgi:hypothetical protein